MAIERARQAIRAFLFPAILLLGPGTADAATGLVLSASASCKAVRLGDEVRITLKIEGDDVAHLGETIELIKETWRSGPVDFTPAHIRLKSGGSDYDYDYGPSASSHKVSDGATNSYARQSWLIKPRKAGDFAITRELFTQWPDGLASPDLVLHVEPAQSP